MKLFSEITCISYAPDCSEMVSALTQELILILPENDLCQSLISIPLMEDSNKYVYKFLNEGSNAPTWQRSIHFLNMLNLHWLNACSNNQCIVCMVHHSGQCIFPSSCSFIPDFTT